MLIPFSKLINKYNIRPKGILHVGSSLATEAETYYKNGIERTAWIEAIPDVYSKMVKNVLKYPNTQTVNACIDETVKEVEFNISSNGGESSSIFEFGEHSKLHPDVTFTDKINLTTCRIDSLNLDLTGFDFLNIDLQGSELSALKSMGTLINQFNYVYLEVNKKETYKGIPLFDEVKVWLIEKGFELKEVVWVGDCWGDAYFERNLKVRNGKA
jgi:FkbM family methyltransferase